MRRIGSHSRAARTSVRAFLLSALVAARGSAGVEPSNLPLGACNPVAAPSLTVGAGGSTGFSTDSACDDVVPQDGGPDLCLLRFSSITVAAGGTLNLLGSRPVALLSLGDVLIEGKVDASAHGAVAGPGGGASPPGVDGSVVNAGGGGGGFGTSGGHGGAGPLGDPGGNGGLPGGSTELSPLIGGGRGGDNQDDSGIGGASGGAMQLVACGTFSATATSMLLAAGAGGLGGAGSTIFELPHAGGGGGSGGGILIEADHLLLVGAAAANGGGGGGGGNDSQENGQTGGAGSSGTTGGSGGPGATQAGAGGAGGSASVPIDGTASLTVVGAGGGGGGAAGRIRVNWCSGGRIDAAIVSPPASIGSACPSLNRLFADGFEIGDAIFWTATFGL